MEQLKNLLFELSAESGISYADGVKEIIKKNCSAKETGKNLLAEITGESDYTVLLDAHFDEVGFTVTDINEDGFLTVSACGGIDKRTLPAKQVIIHGKKDVMGVFCSIPPHLKKEDLKFDDIGDFKIDTLLGSAAKDIIFVGDAVTFYQKPTSLLNDTILGKALDNRIGCAVLLETYKRLKAEKLPVNVCFLFSNEEELGLRGAKTASFGIKADEAVVVDVTFGNAPDVKPTECGILGGGSMIGISPVLCKEMSTALLGVAKANNIPYQTEVMAGKTGTNADVISLDKSGVKTVTVSVPIRNMHTSSEVADMRDVSSAVDLLCEYILKGGIKNV